MFFEMPQRLFRLRFFPSHFHRETVQGRVLATLFGILHQTF